VSCSPTSRARATKVKKNRTRREEPDRPPTVFVCVYRQFIPEKLKLRECVARAAARDPQIRALYDRLMDGNSVYDWGDDPSFFSAEYFQGAAENAAWGVCRPNVREKVKPNDTVVFFCARRARKLDPIQYLFVGYGTVSKMIEDRRSVWRQDELTVYRKHLNVLAKPDLSGQLVNAERFLPEHEDWPRRAASPYVIFDPERSRFNMTNPSLVAYAEPGANVETWFETDIAQEIWCALFVQLGIMRTLRVSAKGSSHPHINLTNNLANAGMTAAELVDSLHPLVRPE